MKSVRIRIAGALAVGAMATVGVVVVSPPASSAVTFASPVYFCTPNNTVVAAQQANFDFFGNITWTDFTTQTLLLSLNGQLNPYGIGVPNNPILPVTFSTNLPAAVPPSVVFSPSVNFSVTLPTDLTNAVTQYLGIPSVVVNNTTIRINSTNTTPSSFLGTINNQTVPLVLGAAATGVANGSLTTGASGGISLFPSVAHVELDLGNRYIDNVNVSGIYVPVHLLLKTVIFDCAPTTTPQLGATLIDPNAPPPPPPVTTTTVVGATTTTAAATTTTAAAPTTTVAGATTTTLVPITNPAYCTWPIFVWFQAVPWFCAPPPPSIP